MAKTMTLKEQARKHVAQQLISMLYNNVLCENGFEQFSNWCEQGEVFAENGLPKDLQEECISLMKKIDSDVNKIAWELEVATRKD